MGISALLPVRVAKNWPPERGMQSTLQTHAGEMLYKNCRDREGVKPYGISE
jgi:hypothetical protein